VSSDLRNEDACAARILDAHDDDTLERLRADPRIEFIDCRAEQLDGLRRLTPPPDPALIAEPMRWAYYPWRRAVVSVLGPKAFRAVRLDRNRHLITAGEQERLGAQKIGVIGLSAGHAIAYTLAAEGLCGELRLADFDSLELSNLNRVPATVLDIGLNKAMVAARRIAEVDPYLTVRVHTSGLTPDTVDDLLDGLDVVVEECDSLDMKVIVREDARARRIPVLMVSSDRGLLDVERFDLEPRRPILHGLLGDVDREALSSLTTRDKVPHILRILGAAQLSSRVAASLVEVGNTVSTWPQLAGELALGGTAVAEAVRRIGLGESLPSGRVRIDIASALDHLAELDAPAIDAVHLAESEDPADVDGSPDVVDIIAAAAIRAPSGGNAQPWQVETKPDAVTIRLAPEHTSTMDVKFRGSATAVGAATYNARVAAAAHGVLGPTEFGERNGQSPLQAVVRLGNGDDHELARRYPAMRLRETNRHHGSCHRIPADTVALLESAARREGTRLALLLESDEIEKAATILAATDRIRYLTPRLHAEMISELRWPADESGESGIDVRSLGLESGDLVKLDMLRRPEVMAHLADWEVGGTLGDDTYDRVRASSAVAIVSVQGHSLTDYARGGCGVEAVWIVAQEQGLAVQPVSPVFLYAHDHNDLGELSPAFASSLQQLQYAFRELAGTPADEAQVLVLRFFDGPPTSVRSRRRGLDRIRAPRG
jgi:molybdopterin/thiamine biosynthesis adenylyltransferase